MKIRYVYHIIPEAYHGTAMARAREIAETGAFRTSRKKSNHLGDGVYFYEGSEWHAAQWAKRITSDGNIGIICASINLGKCFDLHNYAHRRLLRHVRGKLRRKGIEGITDALVINFYANNIEQFDTIRATRTVPEKGKIFPESRYHEFTELVICVRNLKMILNIQLTFQGREYHG